VHNDIRELNNTELNAVSGGLGVLAGIALGVAANAVYDYMKDQHGISDAINYIKNQQK
jgi:bacteriocin-like protein